MKVLKIIIIVVFVLGCNTKKQSVEDVTKEVINNELPDKKDISTITFVDILPDSKTKKTIESWQAYNTIKKAINDLKQANFEFYTGDFNAFELAVKDLDITIPKVVNTAPVKARILALKTKLFKLQDIINLKTTTKQQNLKAITDVFQAFSNLNLQMNKKFEKESQNLQKYIE